MTVDLSQPLTGPFSLFDPYPRSIAREAVLDNSLREARFWSVFGAGKRGAKGKNRSKPPLERSAGLSSETLITEPRAKW